MLVARQTHAVAFAAAVHAATGRLLDGLLPAHDPLEDPRLASAVVEQARRQKVVPMLDAMAGDLGWVRSTSLQRTAEVHRLLSARFQSEVGRIVARLGEAEVRCMVLKGTDLQLSCYPPSLGRALADADILVAPADLGVATSAIRDLGFEQGGFDLPAFRVRPVAAAEQARLEASHYELVAFFRTVRAPELDVHAGPVEPLWPARITWLDGQAQVALALDLHLNLSPDFDIADVWHAPRRLRLTDAGETLAQSFTDACWFLAARAYHEVMTRDGAALRGFADVLAVLARHGEDVDWPRLLAIAEKYTLQPGLYYVLSHAREILGDVVPEQLLLQLDPATAGISRLHDWGDLLPKLLGASMLAPWPR